MKTCRSPRLAVQIVWAGAVLAGALPAVGQVPSGAATAPPEGWTLAPSVSLATLYDDNIFVTSSDKQSDTILRLSPSLAIGYRSPRTTFDFGYGFDAEKYRQHPDLNSWDTRQNGLIGVGHHFSERFQAGVSGTYAETHDPGELTPIGGLVLTRTRATSAAVRPNFTYRFDRLTSTTVFYDRTRQDISGGPRTDISTASLAVDREISSRDKLEFEFQNIAYDFQGASNATSRLFTLGWSHALSSDSELNLRAGPRDTEGRVVPEILASIRKRSQNTSLSLTYARSQLAIVGQSGVVDTQSLEVGVGFYPAPGLSFGFAPGVYHDTQGGASADVYHLGAYLNYAFARDWAFSVSYDYGHQKGTLGAPADQVLVRNVVAVGIRWMLGGPGRYRAPYTAVPTALP